MSSSAVQTHLEQTPFGTNCVRIAILEYLLKVRYYSFLRVSSTGGLINLSSSAVPLHLEQSAF